MKEEARVYKPWCKQRDGTKCRTRKFYVEFRDHWKIVHRLAGFTDQRLTKELARNIMELVKCRAVGLEPGVKLHQWLEGVSDGLLKKLISWGLVDGQRGEVSKPLLQHVEEWRAVLKARGRSKDYYTRVPNRVKTILKKCRFVYFRDITLSSVETFAGTLKENYSDTSVKHYLDAVTAFVNWAREDGRILRNPLEKLAKPDRDEEEKGILEPEQFIRLLQTTFKKDVKMGNSTGTERAVLYLLAGVTGLRRRELLYLTWDNIRLSEDDAFLRVPSKLAKNHKQAEQPIAPATVAILQALKQHQNPKRTDRIFACLGTWINTAELIRQDLKRADLPLVDRDGNEICFHSLRNSYASFLANSQTPVKTIQKLMRHSDPKLTFNTYARSFNKTEKQAIKQLPDLTDFAGQFCLARCLAHQGARHRPIITSSEKVDAIFKPKTHKKGTNCVAKNTPKGSRTPVSRMRT